MNGPTDGVGPEGPASGRTTCDRVRELLPLRVAGLPTGTKSALVDRHLSECGACADEARFVHRVRTSRPEPPEGLVEAVLQRLPSAGTSAPEPRILPFRRAWVRRPRRFAVGWGLSAAAVFILALGIGVMWTGDESGPAQALIASLVPEGDAPEPEGWMVAGAPVLDALPDEVLFTLMEEYDS
jgi:predicted anti-sigma-YlaC factor YlaD